MNECKDIAEEIQFDEFLGDVLWAKCLVLDRIGQRSEAISEARKTLRKYIQVGSPDKSLVEEKLKEWGEPLE